MSIYPIQSLLRRLAAHTVYLDKGLLRKEGEGNYSVPVENDADFVDLSDKTWRIGKSVRLFDFHLRGRDPLRMAQRMSKNETDLARELKLDDSIYTLLVGPELVEEARGVVTRRLRLGLVRGLWRHGSLRLVPGSLTAPVKKTVFVMAPQTSKKVLSFEELD